MLWGALSQSLPDIDVLADPFTRPERGYLIHRGITHSLLFALLAGLILAGIIYLTRRKEKVSFNPLFLFFGFELMLHDLLDTCNSYGTGLLEPFSHHRFSINLLYVADPLFTLGLLIAAIYLTAVPSSHKNRNKWAATAIGLSILYLVFAFFCKSTVDTVVIQSLQKQKQRNFFTTPAPFNCMLWYVAVKSNDGYLTTYRSVWDSDQHSLRFEYHPKREFLLKNINDPLLINDLKTFAQNDYVVTRTKGNYYFNIVRFEQVQGWNVPDASFAFSYPLIGGSDKTVLLQKGRLQGWNSQSFKNYIRAIFAINN